MHFKSLNSNPRAVIFQIRTVHYEERLAQQKAQVGQSLAAQTLRGLAFPIDRNAEEALCSLRAGADNYVQLVCLTFPIIQQDKKYTLCSRSTRSTRRSSWRRSTRSVPRSCRRRFPATRRATTSTSSSTPTTASSSRRSVRALSDGTLFRTLWHEGVP